MGFTSGGYIMQRGLGRAQFRKLETVASRLSHCDHFYGNRFFQPSGLSPSCLSFVVLAIGGVFTPVLAKQCKRLNLVDVPSVGTSNAHTWTFISEENSRAGRHAMLTNESVLRREFETSNSRRALGLLARVVRQNLTIVQENNHRARLPRGARLVDRSQQRAVFGGRTPAKVAGCAWNHRPAKLPPAPT